MPIILMDTKHHKTIPEPIYWSPGMDILVPVQLHDARVRSLDELGLLSRLRVVAVTFRDSGAKLYGDPVYHQADGPEIPPSFWGCHP